RWASTRRSPESRRPGRRTAISPASTRRRTTRATWKAASRRATGPRPRSWEISSSEDARKRVDDLGVELRARSAAELLERPPRRARRAVRARRRDRAVRVARADDARDARDRLPGEPVRV